MKMLSFFACSAFAALLFAACSDDPVTGTIPPAGGGAGQGGGTALDSTRNMSLNLKGCYGHPYDALLKTAATNPKAYLVVDEAGYHVVLPNIVDACGYANIVFNNQRVLDTLKINFVADQTECMALFSCGFVLTRKILADGRTPDSCSLGKFRLCYSVSSHLFSHIVCKHCYSSFLSDCPQLLIPARMSRISAIPEQLASASSWSAARACP